MGRMGGRRRRRRGVQSAQACAQEVAGTMCAAVVSPVDSVIELGWRRHGAEPEDHPREELYVVGIT